MHVLGPTGLLKQLESQSVEQGEAGSCEDRPEAQLRKERKEIKEAREHSASSAWRTDDLQVPRSAWACTKLPRFKRWLSFTDFPG